METQRGKILQSIKDEFMMSGDTSAPDALLIKTVEMFRSYFETASQERLKVLGKLKHSRVDHALKLHVEEIQSILKDIISTYRHSDDLVNIITSRLSDYSANASEEVKSDGEKLKFINCTMYN